MKDSAAYNVVSKKQMSASSRKKFMKPRIWMFLTVFITTFIIPAQAEQDSNLSDQSTTVRLREEPLQWTPETVTVIEKADIEVTYRRDLEDLQGIAPGVIIDSMSGTPSGAVISIRGLGSSETSKGFEPAVAVIVDGVYVGTHTSQMQVLFDFEQIEVARGPQTTYQGAPNIGGTVNLQRTKPTGEFDAVARMSFGDYDRREVDAVVNFPILQNLAGKVSLSWLDGGGDYMRNVTSGRSENDEDRFAISTSFLWELNDSFSIQYTFDNETDNADTPAILNISTEDDLVCIISQDGESCGSNRGPAIPQTNSIALTAQNFSKSRELEGTYHTLRMDLEWENNTLTSITGLRNTEEKMDQDIDATHINFYSISSDQSYDQFSQELRLSGQYSESLHYTTGLYILETEYKLEQDEFFILNALGNAGLGNDHPVNDIQRLNSKTDSSLFSIFAHADYALDDQWTIDLGARLASIEKEFKHSPLGVHQGGVVTPSPVFIDKKDNWNEQTLSAGISFKVDQEAMIYARFSQGYRPGGFNENAVSENSAFSYDAETSENLEIGMKSEWFNDKLRLNMAYYQIDYEDKQEQFISAVAPGNLESVIDNVSSVEVAGFELEFEYVPFENFLFRGSYNNMDSNYESYEIPNPSVPGEIINLSNLQPGWAPSNSYYFSGLYSFNFASGVINVFAAYSYVDDYQTNPKLPVSNVNNYTEWDMSIDYVWQQWTFRLFSHNLNDKRYLQNAVNLTDADVSPLGPTATGATGLVTYAEYNRPRYTGFEIIYKPDLGKMFK
jgi:iron complex outermembrane receptor protein